MIMETSPWKAASSFIPGGNPEKIAYHVFSRSETLTRNEDFESARLVEKQISNARRALDGLIKDQRNLTDLSWEKILRTLAAISEEPEVETDRKLRQVKITINEYEEKKYPLGIIGFISQEILPNNEYLGWIKPTLDHEIELTSTFFRSRNNRTKQLNALSKSDAANTKTGQALLHLFQTSNEQTMLGAAAAGLTLLTYFQLFAMAILGGNIRNRELELIADVLQLKPAYKSSVDAWFHMLRRQAGDKSWRNIYQDLSRIRSMEFDWETKTGTGKLRNIRQGTTPLLLDQVVLLAMDSTKRTESVKENVVSLTLAYRLAVIADNFRREWNEVVVKLPCLDLKVVLLSSYPAARKRYHGQHKRRP